MGNEEMGRDSSRFWKKGIKYSSPFGRNPLCLSAFRGVKSSWTLFTHSSPLFTGMWLGACRLFLFYIAKVIKIFNIIVVLNKNYIFFDMEE